MAGVQGHDFPTYSQPVGGGSYSRFMILFEHVDVINLYGQQQDKTRYISDRTGYGFRNTFIYIYM